MYDDLDRPPLRAHVLNRALSPEGWRVEVLATTPSTNAVVTERARAGEAAGLVVVAEEQTAGRGRLDRTWVSPPRAGLTFSVLLRPDLPLSDYGWLSLLAGLAVADAVRDAAGVNAVLKWPNDVLVDGRKLCGILAEVAEPGAVVIGIGLNVSTRPEELPEGGTSLAVEGTRTADRDTVLRAVLRQLSRVLDQPERAREDYRARCATLGLRVRLLLASGATTGTAESIDPAGRLVVDGTVYGAGDVVHLRPAGA